MIENLFYSMESPKLSKTQLSALIEENKKFYAELKRYIDNSPSYYWLVPDGFSGLYFGFALDSNRYYLSDTALKFVANEELKYIEILERELQNYDD